MNKGNTIWGNAILAIASIIVALVLCELILRLFMPEIGWAQREDVDLGWSSDEYLHFDSASPTASQDTIKILFLGDSFIAGSGVRRLDQRFPSVLNRKLGRGADVKILAAGGWGTDQQLLAFQQKGKQWRPDIVILAFCANNDISNNLSNSQDPRKKKPYFVVSEDNDLILFDAEGRPLSWAPVSQSATGWRIYLIDFLRYITRNEVEDVPDPGRDNTQSGRVDKRYTRFRYWEEKPGELYRKQPVLSWSPQNGVNHVSGYIHDDFPTNMYQWRLFKRILASLKSETDAIGARLVVMLLPVVFNPRDVTTIAGGDFEMRFNTPSGEFTFRSREPRDRLMRISEELDIAFFDPTSEFISYVTSNNVLDVFWPNPGNRHFSAPAHRLLGEITYRYVTDDLGVIDTMIESNNYWDNAP